MKWQTIDTAPTSGEFLGINPHGHCYVLWADDYIDRNGRREYYNGDVYCIATHWMPLPEPPQSLSASSSADER